MKLTARDKKLLIGLGIFIFIIVFIKFLLLPKLDNIKTLNADITSLNNTYASNMIYKTKTDSIDSDIKILAVKLKNLRVIYPPTMDISQLLVVMKELSNESKLEIASMQFVDLTPTNLVEKNSTEKTRAAGTDNAVDAASERQAVEPSSTDTPGVGNGQPAQQQEVTDKIINSRVLNYFYQLGLKSYQFKSSNTSSTDTADIPDGKGYSLSIKIDAKGTNEQIKTFLDNLNKLGTKAYCKSADITGLSEVQNRDSGDGQLLKLSAEIVFYGIMDKGACGYYLLPDGKWIPEPTTEDKVNLFREYSGYETTNIDGSGVAGFANGILDEESKSKDNKGLDDYDFSVVASAFGGGLAPSVSVACENPRENVTYSNPIVYGDSKGIENAEIFIEEKAGKYYCKIKTNHESYPDKQYSETFEFVPERKDLRLVILSSKRNGDEDKAEIDLSIINNTNKNLTYLIKNDDAKSPRVKIGKTVGSVINEK